MYAKTHPTLLNLWSIDNQVMSKVVSFSKKPNTGFVLYQQTSIKNHQFCHLMVNTKLFCDSQCKEVIVLRNWDYKHLSSPNWASLFACGQIKCPVNAHCPKVTCPSGVLFFGQPESRRSEEATLIRASPEKRRPHRRLVPKEVFGHAKSIDGFPTSSWGAQSK